MLACLLLHFSSQLLYGNFSDEANVYSKNEMNHLIYSPLGADNCDDGNGSFYSGASCAMHNLSPVTLSDIKSHCSCRKRVIIPSNPRSGTFVFSIQSTIE